MPMRLFLLLILGLFFLSNCQRDSSTITPSENAKLVGNWRLTKSVGGLGGWTVTPQETSILRFTSAGTYARLIAGVTRQTGRYDYTPIANAKPNEKQATITLSKIVFYNSSGQQSSTSDQPVNLVVLDHTDSKLTVYEDQVADGYVDYYTRAN